MAGQAHCSGHAVRQVSQDSEAVPQERSPKEPIECIYVGIFLQLI